MHHPLPAVSDGDAVVRQRLREAEGSGAAEEIKRGGVDPARSDELVVEKVRGEEETRGAAGDAENTRIRQVTVGIEG